MTKLNSLRLARLKAGKSQYEIALESGIAQPLISLYERELREPKSEHLESLAQCYGVSVEEIQEERLR